MAYFSWDSVILHKHHAVEVSVRGKTEESQDADASQQAHGLLGPVTVFIKDASNDEDQGHVVDTYAELRALYRSAKAYRNFSDIAKESFDAASDGGIVLGNAHKQIYEDTRPMVCALYQIVKMINTNGNRVWLHAGDANLSEASDSSISSSVGSIGQVVPSPSRSRSSSPEAQVPTSTAADIGKIEAPASRP